MHARRLVFAMTLVASACTSGASETTPVLSPFAIATTTPATTPATTTPATTTTFAPAATTTTTTLPVGTLEEDARAVILAGLPGTILDNATAGHLAAGGRGIIIFTKNMSSAGQLSALTSAMACAAGGEILVAVDQEPGRVDRLAKVGLPSPDPFADRETFISESEAMATEMIGLGINLDLAPVIDVARGSNPVLVGRNFGSDPEVVAQRGTGFISALQQAGVGTTAKHFPGHGLSTVDPHLVVTPIDAGLEVLTETDFPPFATAIAEGVGAVMVGHPIYAAIDPDNPASLSPAVLDLLRSEFAFDGVAMTDAFSMAGVREGTTLGDIAVEALAAGEDMLIVDNPLEVEPAVQAIIEAVNAGRLDRDRLAQAAGRVRRLAMSVAPVECGS
ncbi:MAG: glycoside hydrolase family 3 N-terminal domain-containing protein [Acidimicrobiia bacterium]